MDVPLKFLSPLYVKMPDEIKNNQFIPYHVNTALISDPIHCSSYRAISLINTDVTIISKALTTRIESVISSPIHPDRTDILSIIHLDFSTSYISLTKVTIKQRSSQNAEEAFDKVNGTFLMETLIYPMDQNTLQLNIEPLAAAIHQNVNITGIHTNNVTHELSLYADDALLFPTNQLKN